jgi:hypothetical protein
VHEIGDTAHNKNAHQKKPFENNREFPLNLTSMVGIVLGCPETRVAVSLACGFDAWGTINGSPGRAATPQLDSTVLYLSSG